MRALPERVQLRREAFNDFVEKQLETLQLGFVWLLSSLNSEQNSDRPNFWTIRRSKEWHFERKFLKKVVQHFELPALFWLTNQFSQPIHDQWFSFFLDGHSKRFWVLNIDFWTSRLSTTNFLCTFRKNSPGVQPLLNSISYLSLHCKKNSHSQFINSAGHCPDLQAKS